MYSVESNDGSRAEGSGMRGVGGTGGHDGLDSRCMPSSGTAGSSYRDMTDELLQWPRHWRFWQP
jgi:hypothetical protein